MTVTTQHPQYKSNLSKWQTMRDCVSGQEAMRANASKYVPPLSGLSDEELSAYYDRAVYVNFVGRVKDAQAAMLFRKPPQYSVSTALELILNDVTLDGISMTSFAEKIVNELLEVTRCGVLVDHPQYQTPDGQVLTRAAQEGLGLRPYARMYYAENIVNWRAEERNGSIIVTRVVLFETSLVDGDNEFEQVVEERFRVLELVDGVYIQRIFKPIKRGGSEFVENEQITPLMAGLPLTYIPFVFFGSTDSGSDVERPMLLDLANLNIAHYRNYADYENAIHFTGLPTAVITGVNAQADSPIVLGSTQAMVFSNPQAKAEFLEFKGEGLGTLRTAMQDKKDEMAVLGARMLASEKKAAEAAETMAERSRGEIGVLTALSLATSRGLNQVLDIMADWLNISGDNTVELNTDFVNAKLGAQEITAIVNGWLSGAYSRQEMFGMLQRGELISDGADYESELAAIEAEGMTVGQQ